MPRRTIATLTRGKSEAQKQKIREAHAYGKKYLRDLKRRTGETYAEHCLEVAIVLGECTDNASLLSVALLHDLPLHPDGESVFASAPLTDSEKKLIRSMHLLRRLHIDERTEDLDKVIQAITGDVRLLPLRLAHRMNDVRHLDRFGRSMARKVAEETLYMYSAIAGRMGMNAWRQELEDTCFTAVQKRHARKLRQKFDAMKEIDEISLKQAGAFLRRKLKRSDIDVRMTYRIKGLYSAYRKMVLKQRAFEDLTDRLALRVITKNELDCYKALGVIHAYMNPIAGKLKDYIGSPKENGYRSIHTVVYPLPGVTEQPMEVQIRTEQMHRDCEFGVAAHAKYKRNFNVLERNPARVNLFRNLEHLRSEARSPVQFEEALRRYFRDDHIVVFDTRNNLYHIKKPATALDFACMAYPKRFAKVKEVFLNGRKSEMSRDLQDGDIVDIRFTRSSSMTRKWLSACKHRSSKQLIQSVLNK